MLAFHDEPKLKAKTVLAMKLDIKAERLVPGHYWNGETGCFVGCVIRGSEHSKFEDVLGIPGILARFGDGLYEGLGTAKEKQKFAVDFLQSIKVGADLSGVWARFAHPMLVDKKIGVIRFAKNERTKKAIQDVADLYLRKIKGEKIDVNAWLEARKNAADAYADAYAATADAYADAYAATADAAAAYAATAAAAAYAAATAAAATAAATAAAYAAAYADAYAATADAAYTDARSRHYAALASLLIGLLKGAKRKNG